MQGRKSERQGGTTKGTKQAKVEEWDHGAIEALSSRTAAVSGSSTFVRFARFVVPRISPNQSASVRDGGAVEFQIVGRDAGLDAGVEHGEDEAIGHFLGRLRIDCQRGNAQSSASYSCRINC